MSILASRLAGVMDKEQRRNAVNARLGHSSSRAATASRRSPRSSWTAHRRPLSSMDQHMWRAEGRRSKIAEEPCLAFLEREREIFGVGERETRLDGGEEKMAAGRCCLPEKKAAPPLRGNVGERWEGIEVSPLSCSNFATLEQSISFSLFFFFFLRVKSPYHPSFKWLKSLFHPLWKMGFYMMCLIHLLIWHKLGHQNWIYNLNSNSNAKGHKFLTKCKVTEWFGTKSSFLFYYYMVNSKP